MKKRVISILLSAVMILSLAACGGQSSSGTASGDSNNSNSASGSDGQTYDWSIATVLASGTLYEDALNHFADLLAEKSDGRIKLTVYMGGQLGSEKENIEALQMNGLEFFMGSSASMSSFTDAFAVWDLPYLFPSTEAARGVLDGECGQEVMDKLTSTGVKGLAYFENGMYVIASKTPIRQLSDVSGMRVRCIESNVQTDTYQAFGANPVVLSWGDIYTAMSNGTCDAISSTSVTGIYSAKFQEVAPYITRTEHIYSPHVLLMSQTLWDSLPADIQQIVQEASNEARDYDRELVSADVESTIKTFEEQGCEVIEVDKQEWMDAVKPVYEKHVGAGGVDQDLFDRIQTAAAAYQ